MASSSSKVKTEINDEDVAAADHAIGIDLGTTHSCVAVAINGNIEIIPNDHGNRTTPSCVAFSSTGSDRLIGEAARNQAALYPHRTAFHVKRLIGKKFDDREVQNDMRYLPFPVVNVDGNPHVALEVNPGGQVKVKTFSPEAISGMVLEKMKQTAETRLGVPVTDAVVTVPAYFNDAQRQATKDAATIAGLNVLRIVNEPTAAAIAFAMNRQQQQNPRKRKRDSTSTSSSKSSRILVYDLGGGTIDVSVVQLDGREVKVLATGGDTHLGGGDFDERVMGYFVKMIKNKYGKDISGESKAMGRLRKECERAKRALSSQSQVRVEIESLIAGGVDFSEPLSRAKFEALNMDLFKKTLDVVERVLKDGKVEKRAIEEIVLVGGSTRIPKLREMLKLMFDGKEPYNGVNPDEAVAYGAALLAANLTGQPTAQLALTLCDVTPLSLGISVHGGLMSVVIPRNTPIPTKITEIFTTTEPSQTTIEFQVFQGERASTKDCLELGSFELRGIPRAPIGVADVEVTFEINADGILSVTAKDKATAKSKSLTITNYKGNLHKEEIERMVKEAKEMAKQDKKEKERVEARNQLEGLINDVKSALLGDIIGWAGIDKRNVKKALEEASTWFDEYEDNAAVKKASRRKYAKRMKRLAEVWDPIMRKIYGKS